MKKPLKAFVFDVDGTLAMPGEIKVEERSLKVDAFAFGQACRQLGLKLGDSEDFLNALTRFGENHLPGKGYIEAYELLKRQLSHESLITLDDKIGDEQGFSLFKATYDQHFAEQIPVCSMARLATVEALRGLTRRKAVVGVASNSARLPVDANLLEICGLKDLAFSFRVPFTGSVNPSPLGD